MQLKRQTPIEGVSHWCDGKNLDGSNCGQIVKNENARCEAGHPNAIRRVFVSSRNHGRRASESSLEVEELLGQVSPDQSDAVVGQDFESTVLQEPEVIDFPSGMAESEIPTLEFSLHSGREVTDRTKRYTQTSAPPTDYIEIASPAGMTSMDYSVDDGIADRLRTEKVWTRYAGWGFNGRVWFDAEGAWSCQVWIYGKPRTTVCADTIEELLRVVSDCWDCD